KGHADGRTRRERTDYRGPRRVGMVREEDMRFAKNGPNDFWWELRWRGYTPTKAGVEEDPQAIRGRPAILTRTKGRFPNFYTAFGDNTVRKILRSVFSGPKTRDEILAALVVNPLILDRSLASLEAWGVLAGDGGVWRKGPTCASIDNLGHTLEW